MVVIALQVDPTMQLDRFLNDVSNRSESVGNDEFVSLRLDDGGYHGWPHRRLLGTRLESWSFESSTNGVLAVVWDIFFKYLSSHIASVDPCYLTKININADNLGT